MSEKLKLSLFIVSMLFISGCNSNKVCSVKIYSPNCLTFSKECEPFNDICKNVLLELNHKRGEKTNSLEQRSRHRWEKEKCVFDQTYYKTIDDNGYEYIITSTTLGNDNPVVTLETTNPDKEKLVNALREEFLRSEFNVKIMY